MNRKELDDKVYQAMWKGEVTPESATEATVVAIDTILDALIAEADIRWTGQGFYITSPTEDSRDEMTDWLRSLKGDA